MADEDSSTLPRVAVDVTVFSTYSEQGGKECYEAFLAYQAALLEVQQQEVALAVATKKHGVNSNMKEQRQLPQQCPAAAAAAVPDQQRGAISGAIAVPQRQGSQEALLNVEHKPVVAVSGQNSGVTPNQHGYAAMGIPDACEQEDMWGFPLPSYSGACQAQQGPVEQWQGAPPGLPAAVASVVPPAVMGAGPTQQQQGHQWQAAKPGSAPAAAGYSGQMWTGASPAASAAPSASAQQQWHAAAAAAVPVQQWGGTSGATVAPQPQLREETLWNNEHKAAAAVIDQKSGVTPNQQWAASPAGMCAGTAQQQQGHQCQVVIPGPAPAATGHTGRMVEVQCGCLDCSTSGEQHRFVLQEGAEPITEGFPDHRQTVIGLRCTNCPAERWYLYSHTGGPQWWDIKYFHKTKSKRWYCRKCFFGPSVCPQNAF